MKKFAITEVVEAKICNRKLKSAFQIENNEKYNKFSIMRHATGIRDDKNMNE